MREEAHTQNNAKGPGDFPGVLFYVSENIDILPYKYTITGTKQKTTMNINEFMKKLFSIAENILPGFIETHKNELNGREGGQLIAIPRIYSSELNSNNGFFIKVLGNLPAEKRSQKETFARNKVNYLKSMLADISIVSSYSGWDEEKGIYGGGIKTRNYIIAFSGFPPHLDQKFCIILALALNELDMSQAAELENATKEMQKQYANS